MIKKKILLFATVMMASASDLNPLNNIDLKGEVQKIVTEFKDIISNEIKDGNLSKSEKIKACRSFRLLCGYFYFTFEDQFLKKNIKNDIMMIKNNPKNQADFESFISDEYNKLINNIAYLDADNDYFEDCAKKFLTDCDEYINDILQ